MPPDPPNCHCCVQQPLLLPTHVASLYPSYIFVASHPTVFAMPLLSDAHLVSMHVAFHSVGFILLISL